MLAMSMRDAAGRRNLMMNNWVAGQPIPLADYATAERLAGRTEEVWNDIGHKLAMLPDAPRLQAAAARRGCASAMRAGTHNVGNS